MIRIDVSIRRGGFALDASLTSSAHVTGLFGPSGAGKTTLLHAIAGLLQPAAGEIDVDGNVLFSSQRGVDVPAHRRGVGVVFQDDRLFPNRDVRGNLLASRGAATNATFNDVVDLLDLAPLLGRPVTQLSGGERRRVAIGRAILQRPRLLLLDEPMTGLDGDRRRRILAYLLELKRALSLHMLYVSHTVSDVLAVVDELAVVRGGRVAAVGPPEQLLADTMAEADAGPLETTLSGRVQAIEAESGLATIDCDGATLRANVSGAGVGDAVLLSIGAHEALLSVGDPPMTSARNALRGRIVELTASATTVVARVDCGAKLWVEVTPNAADELELKDGRAVWVLVKSRSIRAIAQS